MDLNYCKQDHCTQFSEEGGGAQKFSNLILIKNTAKTWFFTNYVLPNTQKALTLGF